MLAAACIEGETEERRFELLVGGLAPTAILKTAAISHSATPPSPIIAFGVHMPKAKIQGKNTSATTIFTKHDFVSALKKVSQRIGKPKSSSK